MRLDKSTKIQTGQFINVKSGYQPKYQGMDLIDLIQVNDHVVLINVKWPF